MLYYIILRNSKKKNKTAQNTSFLTQFHRPEVLHKLKFCVVHWVSHWEICGNCSLTETHPPRGN